MKLANFNLNEYVQNTEEIPFEEFYLITISLFFNLILLHSTNYCHRDIKPTNILLF